MNKMNESKIQAMNDDFETEPDWKRIRHLLRLGLLAGGLVLIGDMLLGWGVEDQSLTGMAQFLSAYSGISDARLIGAALLGLIGIPVEGMCYFSVYHMMEGYSAKHAHLYRAGVLGYLIFGACGLHVPCCAMVYFYQRLLETNADAAELTMHYAMYFLAPATLLFMISFVLLIVVQIHAFVKGLTPLPRWCWIFSLGFCAVAAALLSLPGNHEVANALSTGWISLGNLWMFGGLLLVTRNYDKAGEVR